MIWSVTRGILRSDLIANRHFDRINISERQVFQLGTQRCTYTFHPCYHEGVLRIENYEASLPILGAVFPKNMGNTNCLCKSISDFLSLVFQGRPFHKIFSETFAKFRMFLQLPPTGKWNYVFSKSFLLRYKINVSFGIWLIYLRMYISFLDSFISTHYIGLRFALQVLNREVSMKLVFFVLLGWYTSGQCLIQKRTNLFLFVSVLK